MWFSLLLILLITALGCWKRRRTAVKNIPGPLFALPLVGHLPYIDTNHPHKTLLAWKKLYGPIFSVQLGQLRTVVLNDWQIIKDAYSAPEIQGRPPQEAFQRASGYKGMVFNSGPGVFEQRKFVIKSMKKFCYEDRGNFESIIQEEVSQIISKFEKNLDKPFKMNHEFNIPALNSIYYLFMGMRFEHDDPKIKYLVKCADTFMTLEGLLPNLGYFVPIIAKLFPNATNFKKILEGGRGLYDFVQSEWCQGSPSRIRNNPRNYKEAWMDKSESASPDSSFHPSQNYFPSAMGDVLLGAVETTAATVDWTLIHLARNQKHQRKLQEELDLVVGSTGLITLADRPALPYLEAVIHEVLRISSLGPFGLLHYATEDWHFKGFTIPKDTCVIGNLYAVHHDPESWENPQEFKPERFLDETGTSIVNTHLILPFSTGKRYCFGENAARDELFLFVGNIFYRMNVSCTENVPDVAAVPGVTATPKPYEIVFSRREKN